MSRRTIDGARMSSLRRVQKVLVGLVRPVGRDTRAASSRKEGICAWGRLGAGHAALGRGRVDHMGRVCIVMRAAGARVRAVVGAGGSSEERFLTCGNDNSQYVYDYIVPLQPYS